MGFLAQLLLVLVLVELLLGLLGLLGECHGSLHDDQVPGQHLLLQVLLHFVLLVRGGLVFEEGDYVRHVLVLLQLCSGSLADWWR